MGDKAVTFVNGKMKRAGDTGTVDFDGNVNLGNADSDNIVFNGEIDSDILPDDNNTYDLGSDSKRWAEGHFEQISFEDTMIIELTIPGLIAQTDTNAYTFNLPYDVTFHRMSIYLTRPQVSSGNTSVTLSTVGGTTLATATVTSTQHADNATTTNFTSASQTTGTAIRLAITSVGGSVQDIRANLYFRRDI